MNLLKYMNHEEFDDFQLQLRQAVAESFDTAETNYLETIFIQAAIDAVISVREQIKQNEALKQHTIKNPKLYMDMALAQLIAILPNASKINLDL